MKTNVIVGIGWVIAVAVGLLMLQTLRQPAPSPKLSCVEQLNALTGIVNATGQLPGTPGVLDMSRVHFKNDPQACNGR